MKHRYFYLEPTDKLMIETGGNFMAVLNACWYDIQVGISDGLISLDSEVEDIAFDYGFKVRWKWC